MAGTVYVLCAATSFLCAWLLLRSYLRTRSRLLLWSSLCFIGLAANNALLVIDLVLVPTVDLSLVRSVLALVALLLLLFGLVWESR
jgi:hydrogenase/urease accessory protein HupE